jgi:DNA-binding GntR family transcriptional regulator
MKTKKEMSKTDMIVDSLREAINHGTLRTKDKIIERKIAEQYKASVIPVREALSILAGEGLIVHRNYASYMVREINLEEMIELFNLIRFLAVYLLNQAIPQYTEITYYQLKSLTREMDKAKNADKNIELLIQFVDGIFLPAGLTLSYNLVKQLLKRNISVLQGVIHSEFNGTIPVTGFNHFIGLCEKHDIENAIKFTGDQLDIVNKKIVAFIISSGGGKGKY